MQFDATWSSPRRLWPLALIGLLTAGLLRATEADEPVAVFAQAFNGYARVRQPDRSFKPEAYVFGEGGCWTRPVMDPGMGEMTFRRVARAVAAPLGRLNYRPALSSAEADLLILVYWGATEGSRGHDPSGAKDRLSDAFSLAGPIEANDAKSPAEFGLETALWQMGLQNSERDEHDNRNARILGYTEMLGRARFAAHMSFAQDIISEVASNRYFVVLQAYDFKTAVKEKKLKPLWTARISMDESRNDFARSLDHMLRIATPYLGQDSDGLHRHLTRESHVELGPLEVIETLPTPPPK